MSAELHFSGVTFSHQGSDVPAVHDLSLRVAAGELVALLGASGSGKSTALRLAAGLEEPSAGDVLINGISQRGVSPQQRGIAMVFQKPLLFPHLSVIDNVAFADRIRGRTKRAARSAAREYLELVQVADLADRRSRELSGGQEQRVAVARALAARPSILLLDEPFGALDIAVRESLYEVLSQVREHLGPTILMVTHDLAEAGLADRVAILDEGSITADGDLAALYAAPANVQVARLLGGFTEISGQVRAGIHHSAAGRVPLPAACEVADGAAMLLLHRQGVRLEPCPVAPSQMGDPPAGGGSPADGDLFGQVSGVRTSGLRLRVTILLNGVAELGRPAQLEAEVDGGPPWGGAAAGMWVRIRPGVPGAWAVPATSRLPP